MRAVFNTAEAAAALGLVLNVVDRRHTIPILSHVLLEVSDGVGRFSGTNLDADAWATFDVEGSSEGSVALPAMLLGDLLRSYPSGAQAELKWEKPTHRATLTVGGGRSTMPTLPVEDFPKLSAPNWRACLTMDRGDLREAIRRVAPCAGKEVSRLYWCGVRVAHGPSGLLVAGVHAHALAEVTLEAVAGDIGVTVPKEIVAGCLRILGGDGDVEVRLSPERFGIETARYGLTSKTIDMPYPDYHRVLRRDAPWWLKTQKSGLAPALRRAELALDPDDHGIAITFASEGIRIAARNKDVTDLDELVPSEGECEAATARLTLNLLNAGLGVLDHDEIEIGWEGGRNPIVMRNPADPAAIVNIGVWI